MEPAAAAEPPPPTRKILSRPVLAWSLWDWGSAAFNAVITTFVFGVYITNQSLFGPGADEKLGWVIAASAVVIAISAPVVGRQADRGGRRTLWLAIHTGVVIVISASLAFVQPDPSFLWLGLLLLAVGNVFFDLAEVNYFAMLNGLSEPRNVGRISGLGWGLGYIGGIVLLFVILVAFIQPEVGLFGVTSEGAWDVRASMILCAVWTLVFSLPVIISQRKRGPAPVKDQPKLGILAVYKDLFARVVAIWRADRHTIYFLGASAVYRDGLGAVFAFGAVIAAATFGFDSTEVIYFAIVANLVAGIFTITAGSLDDLFGPKPVIIGALSIIIVSGIAIFVLHDRGSWVFWVFGLALSACVGPAQSASRTFLARLIPAGKEGEVFGLYMMTGRAAGFLGSSAFAIAIAIGYGVTGISRGDEERVTYWGILGVVAVLLVGLLLLLPVRSRTRTDSALVSS